MGDKIEKLYQIYDLLNEASDKSKHEREYLEILEAARGSDKEKKLATQFIGKFFKFFPSLSETAIDRQLDLCEEDDVLIRRMAIKELPTFCKDAKENTPRISDILAQLLNSSDPNELQQVNLSLQLLAKFDAIGTISGLFHQIKQGDENVRLRCLEFVGNKIMKNTEIMTKPIEEFIIAEIKKLLQDVSADEFQKCIQILSATNLGTSITGHQEIVKLCAEQADIDTNVSDISDDIYIFLTCVNQALPFFSSKIESTTFVKHTCEKLLPLEFWHLIGAADDDQTQIQLRLLKVFAELCAHCGTLENPKEKIETVFNVLMEFLPPPPEDMNETPLILFSHVECLLYAIHALGKQIPEYLSFKDDDPKLKDFRARLQYLARRTQGYVKKLQTDIKEETVDPKTDEEKIKIIGLKTTSNIQTLIRDLYHPSYKSVINLSWTNEKAKTPTNSITAPAATKTNEQSNNTNNRKRPIAFTKKDGPSNHKQAKQMYSPPSGKFSSRIGTQSSQNNNKFNNFRGKFRGRRNDKPYNNNKNRQY
jgi:hypothetical protein